MFAWSLEEARGVRAAIGKRGAQKRVVDTTPLGKQWVAAGRIGSIAGLRRMPYGQAEERSVAGSGRSSRGAQGEQSAVDRIGIFWIGGVVNVRVREVVPRLRVAQCQQRFRIPYRVDIDFPCVAVDRRRTQRLLCSVEEFEDPIQTIVLAKPGNALAEGHDCPRERVGAHET